MDIRHALLAFLATVPLTACSSTSDCDPLMEGFIVNGPVSAEQLDEIMMDYPLPDQDEVRCRAGCRVAYRTDQGWEAGLIDSCSLTLPMYPNGEGLVSCTGTGWEYMCEE
jgi:hypothetical protein